MQQAICIQIPAIIKARSSTDGRRLVEVESSNEETDSEGDVILQKALMDSKDSFLKNGALDLDHLSEIGARLGIANPTSYIVGRPVDVMDLGKGRTGVRGEISRPKDGVSNPSVSKADEFWESLQREPPVVWQASIYGFPKNGMVEDCRDTGKCEHGAKRYLVKGIDWRSLAFTRNPVNTSLTKPVTIVSAKSFMAAFAMRKDMGFGNGVTYSETPAMAMPTGLSEDLSQAPVMPGPMSWPTNMDELWGSYHRHIKADCMFTKGENSAVLFRDHFQGCCGMDRDSAELHANALMYMILRDRRKHG